MIERALVQVTGESIQNSSLPEDIFFSDTPNINFQYGKIKN
jgi:hypothetical protein